MITVSVRWEDKTLGKVISNDHMLHPDAVPLHMGDLPGYARTVFERVFNEVVQARETAHAAAKAEGAVFPLRFPAGAHGIGSVPLAMVQRHEERVRQSFGCTVVDLARRGGLTLHELIEVLEDWPPGCLAATVEEAVGAVRQAVRLFEAAQRVPAAPGSHLRVVQ